MVDGGPGDRADDPRPLPRLAAQPLERGRVRRPLRPLDGQLRRLPGRLRLRVPRPEGAPRLRPPADAPRTSARRSPRPRAGARPARNVRTAASGGCALNYDPVRLRLKTLELVYAGKDKPRGAVVEGPGGMVDAVVSIDGHRVRLTAAREVTLGAGPCF